MNQSVEEVKPRDTEAFARDQLDLIRQAYMRVRPGSRAAAEIVRDSRFWRDRLANAIRARRRAKQ